jgi:hypothetical protein
MIRCRQCGHPNPIGAIFCMECGGILVGHAAVEQSPRSTAGSPEADPRTTTTDAWATLYLADGDQTFRLTRRAEFTLGRGDDSRTRKPDIDLSPFEAYSSGVSRMHAVVRRKGVQVVLLDLDSANGTYLNGRRLGSREEASLEDGDIIALGALKMRIRLKATR